jgi:hypothetical protein
VHIEIVYGSWVASGLRQALDPGQAFVAFAVLLLGMLALSIARTRLAERRGQPTRAGLTITSRA